MERVDQRYEGVVDSAPNLERLISDSAPAQLDADELTDKVQGTMFGLAVGNLLGLPVEGHWYSDIDRRYPDGVRNIDPNEKYRLMDDDLAQAVSLGEALAFNSDLMHGFAERMIVWYEMNARGCGHTTARVIRELMAGVPPPDAARNVFIELNGIAPNGAVMRCAPVAIAGLNDPRSLVRRSAISSVVTHFAPICQWSCILVNAVIALYCQGIRPDLAALYDAAMRDGMPNLLAQSESDGIPSDVFAAITAGKNLPHSMDWLRVNQRLIGHTLLATQVGLWAARTPLGFEDALVEVVRSGGDTDTNGAVAGAVLGARYGKSAIPTRWLECVPESDRIEDLGMRLGGLA